MNRRSIALFVLFLAACGGNVVVDATSPSSSSSGSGGSPSTQSSTSGLGGGLPGVGTSGGFGGFAGVGGSVVDPGVTVGTAGGGTTCSPISNLTQCSGSATTTSGGPAQCTFDFCGQQGLPVMASATCQGSACTCVMNGATLCTCAVSGGVDLCTNGGTGCCFGQ